MKREELEKLIGEKPKSSFRSFKPILYIALILAVLGVILTYLGTVYGFPLMVVSVILVIGAFVSFAEYSRDRLEYHEKLLVKILEQHVE